MALVAIMRKMIMIYNIKRVQKHPLNLNSSLNNFQLKNLKIYKKNQ